MEWAKVAQTLTRSTALFAMSCELGTMRKRRPDLRYRDPVVVGFVSCISHPEPAIGSIGYSVGFYRHGSSFGTPVDNNSGRAVVFYHPGLDTICRARLFHRGQGSFSVDASLSVAVDCLVDSVERMGRLLDCVVGNDRGDVSFSTHFSTLAQDGPH